MSKTIIINEEIANELKDMLAMTQFKFKANIKKFLASLLEDPTGAEPDMIFTKNGLDKNKLIKALVDNKVITKKMTIDDHDADGKPHTARMIVKYSVPKERFNEKLDALYDILFPDVDARINEEGGAGGGATSCSGVDGNGYGSGEFVQPLFGGISVRKKKNKKKIGGNPYTLNENLIEQENKTYLKEYLDKEYMVPLKKLFNWNDVDKAEECAYWFSDCSLLYDYILQNRKFYRDCCKLIDDFKELFNKKDFFDLGQRVAPFFRTSLSTYAKDFANYASQHCLEYDMNGEIPPFCVAEYMRDVQNEWLIHMNNHNESIHQSGFSFGVNDSDAFNDLIYKTTGEIDDKYSPGYNFAFTADNAGYAEYSGYGENAVLFQASGIEIYHHGDKEKQVIFYGPTAKNLIFLYQTYTSKYGDGWYVYSEITGKPLIMFGTLDKLVQWCINNFSQYRSHLIGKENQRVRMEKNRSEIDYGMVGEAVIENSYTLNESQESKSIDAAKRLFMQRTGKSAEEADKFIRVDLRNDLPVLRDKNGAKFILGVTRMFLDRQLTNASTIQNLNKTLKLLTQGHFNEYDRNLNGMSAQDVISRFSTAMKQMDDQEREELGNMQFNDNGDYQIVRIDDFEHASQYGQYTSWCVTHDEHMLNSYTSNGLGQFYFCLRNGFENELADPGEGCPLDSYGLSMVAVSVDENGRLNTCTCRWNHDNGGNDNIMGVKEISELIGQNFFEVFKPNGKWTEILENAKARLAAGENLYDVFDYASFFYGGLAVVELKSKYNWIRQDNGQFFSDQWFDLCGDFYNGFAWVELNSKYNWIRQDNGQFFSDQWFDGCNDFHEGLAIVELNDKCNWVRQDNGQYFSDQWYDFCDIFREGFAVVRLNGKYNWVRQDNGQLLSEQWFDALYPVSEGLANVKLNGYANWVRLDNGRLLSDQWYDVCHDFHEGFAEVELKGKDNWVRADNGQLLCNQWYDYCGGFCEGLALVELNDKCNWVRQDNGQLLSEQWFDDCGDFHEGFGGVELNGKWYYMRKDGVLCNYETKEPIQQQPGLNEMVNRIIKRIISEAVTGEDAEKAAAIYAYCLDDKEDDYCILCAKRLEGDEKGKWNPPMGHLHVGESPKDGAVRECEEESGVKIPKSKLQVGSYEDWGRNYWVILDGTIKDWPVGKGDGENTKFEWKNVYGLFYGDDKDLEWAWNTKDFIYKFAPAELDLD